MPKIRVLLTDDHAILREGLRALLSYYDDVEVVGEAQNGEEALASVQELQPEPRIKSTLSTSTNLRMALTAWSGLHALSEVKS